MQSILLTNPHDSQLTDIMIRIDTAAFKTVLKTEKEPSNKPMERKCFLKKKTTSIWEKSYIDYQS